MLNYSCIASIAMVVFCIAASPADVVQIKPDAVKKEISSEHDARGLYKITGKGADDTSYSGVAIVKHPVGSKAYMVTQVVGGTLSNGVAIMVEKKLVISWRHGDTLGITCVSFVGRDGTARWLTLPGNGQFKTEQWTFLAENEDD